MFNSFFMWNCYQCVHHTSSNFDVRPPFLEDYLPLNENLIPAPEISDKMLGEVFNYF